MRRVLALLPIVFLAAAGAQPETTASDKVVQFTPPPGEATAEDKSLLVRARELLQSKKADVSAVLVDPAFMPIHARTEFRELIAAHATDKPLTISGPQEPGTRLTVVFEFTDAAAKPVAGAQLYLYHTSSKGWYSDKAAHIRANSGDVNHARLFGYARTDTNGRVTLHTIRPASYPNTDLPQHIHLHLSIGGKEVLVSEVLFEDDPKLSRQALEDGERGGFVAVKVEKAADGSQRCKAVFKLKQ